MLSKKRINRPKLYFRVIRPKIIFHHMKDHFLYPFLFLFIFTLTHFFFGFLFISLFHLFFLVLLHLVFFFNVWFSHESNFFFRTETFRNSSFDNMRLHDHSWSSEFHFFDTCPPVWRVILSRGLERKSSGSKGETIG